MAVCESKKVQQQGSKLQSSNSLPVTNITKLQATSLPLYVILACHESEVGIVSS